jgi:thioredoxin reductase (NADPH)
VSYCAVCDGAFFKDKTIAVVGGSDSAAKEALYLTEHAAKVYIIYRREKIRAEPINTERVGQNDKIEIIPNTNILEIKGDKFVTHAVLDNDYNGSRELRLDGVFIEIGYEPQSELAEQLGVKLENGEIKVGCESETNVPGVYAAGDVTAGSFKQAITAAAQGVTAAKSAYEYISSQEFEEK